MEWPGYEIPAQAENWPGMKVPVPGVIGAASLFPAEIGGESNMENMLAAPIRAADGRFWNNKRLSPSRSGFVA